MLILSILSLVLITAVIFELSAGFMKMPTLEDYCPDSSSDVVVSIIVPACNEEEKIEAGLRSLAGQEYKNIEVVVVNDRSTDTTGEIIDRVRQQYPQIKCIDIKTLPDGWLGKPHALQRGAETATGTYLVFTDADVQLEQSTISRAVTAMETGELDQLALVFKNSSSGALLNAIVGDIGAGLLWIIKPWRARFQSSRYFVGVGAYNMVRTDVYQKIGKHKQIRMQVIDDLFLGKLIKREGYRQECMTAQEFVTVPWYQSVDELISGLMKNVFAFFNYRVSCMLLSVLALVCVVILPYWGAFFCTGPVQLIFILGVVVRIFGIGRGLILSGVEKRAALWLLVTPFILLYIIFRASVMALTRGGISWRGSFYRLEELKKQEWVLSGLFRLR